MRPDAPSGRFKSAIVIGSDASLRTVHVTVVRPLSSSHTASPDATNARAGTVVEGATVEVVDAAVVVVPDATHAATLTDP